MSIAKLTVILLLIFIVASLGLALFHMMRNKGPTDQMVRALTIRVILSIGLFIFLMVAFAAGLLKPHGIY